MASLDHIAQGHWAALPAARILPQGAMSGQSHCNSGEHWVLRWPCYFHQCCPPPRGKTIPKDSRLQYGTSKCLLLFSGELQLLYSHFNTKPQNKPMWIMAEMPNSQEFYKINHDSSEIFHACVGQIWIAYPVPFPEPLLTRGSLGKRFEKQT